MYKQVKFISKFKDSYPLGGIGVFENDKLVRIIAGIHGYIEANNIQQYEIVDWIGLSDPDDDLSDIIFEEDNEE